MTMKEKLLVGAVAAVGVWFLFLRKASAASLTRPTCGPGASWKVVSDPTGYSPSVAESIRRWGGYCAVNGYTEFLGADNKAEQPSLVDGLITMPSQLVDELQGLITRPSQLDDGPIMPPEYM